MNSVKHAKSTCRDVVTVPIIWTSIKNGSLGSIYTARESGEDLRTCDNDSFSQVFFTQQLKSHNCSWKTWTYRNSEVNSKNNISFFRNLQSSSSIFSLSYIFFIVSASSSSNSIDVLIRFFCLSNSFLLTLNSSRICSSLLLTSNWFSFNNLWSDLMSQLKNLLGKKNLRVMTKPTNQQQQKKHKQRKY